MQQALRQRIGSEWSEVVMTTESPTHAERSRKLHALILQRLQEPGRQAAIATAMGVSESTISRLKNEHLESFTHLLVLAGLKVVPVEKRCFDTDMVDALLLLSRDRLQSIQRAEQLTWE